MIRELSFTPYQLLVAFFLHWATFPLYIGNCYLGFMGAVQPEWRCVQNTTSEFGRDCRVMTNCSSGDLEFRNIYQTFTDDFQLYCDRLPLASAVGTFQNVGFILGVFITGQLSDLLGRKIVSVATIAVAIVASTASALVYNYWLFMACRVITVASVGGLDIVKMSLLMEVVEPHHRMTVGAFFWFSGGARVITAGLMWLTGSWRTAMHIINAFSILPLLVTIRWIKESPRWLAQRKKTKELRATMHYISQFNKQCCFGAKETAEEAASTEEALLKIEEDVEKSEDAAKVFSYKDLFSHKSLILRSFITSYFVFAGCITSTGIDFMSRELTGSFVLNNVIIGALSQILKPIAFVVDTVCQKFNRRLLHQLSLGFVVVLILLSAALTAVSRSGYGEAVAAMAMTGRIVLEYQWDAIYLYGVELFPTVLRSTGMSFASTVGRAGDALAPVIAYSGHSWAAAPYFIIAGVGMVGVLISCLFAPDTKGKELPDTLKLKSMAI